MGPTIVLLREGGRLQCHGLLRIKAHGLEYGFRTRPTHVLSYDLNLWWHLGMIPKCWELIDLSYIPV